MPTIPIYERKQDLDPNTQGEPHPKFDTSAERAAAAQGSAIQALGSSLTALGQQWQQRQEQNARFEAGLQDDGRRQDIQIALQKGAEGMPENGDGFHDTFMAQADEIAAKRFQAMPPGQVRDRYMKQWGVEREGWSWKAAEAQHKREVQYSTDQIGRFSENSQREVAANPDAADDLVERGRERINDARGLTTIERAGMMRDYERQVRYAELASRYANDPEGLQRELGTINPKLAAGAGGDYFDRLKQVESGGDPNAGAKTSSARGLYQFTDATWSSVARAHPDLRLTPEGRSDPAQQEKAIRAFTADNAASLRSAGFQATPGNLYAAHFAGAGGAIAALKAASDTPVADVLGQKAVDANPFLKGKTAGEFLQWASRKVGGADLGPASSNPKYAALTFQDTQRLIAGAAAGRNRVTEEQKQQAKLEAYNVGQLVDDDLASLRANGKGVDALSPERVAAALGPAKAAEWQDSRTHALNVFQATSGMETMPADQLQARVDAYRPDAEGGAGYAAKAELFKEVHERAEGILQRRLEDPAAAVDGQPMVAQARARASQEGTVEAREGLVKARIAAQASLDVPEYARSPITVDEAKQYAQKLRPLARGQADVADQDRVIEGVVGEIQQRYGRYAKDVLSRVLYQVTLKKDASEVLAAAMDRLSSEAEGRLVRPEEATRAALGASADDIASFSGAAQPSFFQRLFGGGGGDKSAPPVTMGTLTTADPPVQRQPFTGAIDMLRSDPKRYLPAFVKRFGIERVPMDLRPLLGAKP